MKFDRKTHNNKNIDEAIYQYLNSNKSSYELEKELGIFRGTLYSRLRKMRKEQNVEFNSDLRINKETNKREIKKEVNIIKNNSKKKL